MLLTYVNDERYESENLQKIIIRYEFYNIKSQYPQKIFDKTLDENQKQYTYRYRGCKYDLSFRDGECVETFTITYRPAHIKNHETSKDIEEGGGKN